MPPGALYTNHPDFRWARFSKKWQGRDYLLVMHTSYSKHGIAARVWQAVKDLRARYSAEFRFMRMVAGSPAFPMTSDVGQTYAWIRRVGPMPRVQCENQLQQGKEWVRCGRECVEDLSCIYCGVPCCEACRAVLRELSIDPLRCAACVYYQEKE